MATAEQIKWIDNMDFHDSYRKISPCWKIIRQEFQMINHYTIITPIKNYDIICRWGRLTGDGHLTVYKGFSWGASGITIDTKDTRRGSCFHDLLYWMRGEGLFGALTSKQDKDLKKLADLLMYSLMVEDGMWQCRAKKWYAAVDAFGDIYWSNGE